MMRFISRKTKYLQSSRYTDPSTRDTKGAAIIPPDYGISAADQPAIVQRKMTMGLPHDQYEQEADSIANQVVKNQPEEGVSPETITDDEPKRIQRKTLSNSPANGIVAPSAVAKQLQGKQSRGATLPQPTRAEMESVFDKDLSKVRLHTDVNAVQMNQMLDALAFTHQSDVYFNQGEYNPHSRQGKHLLAHELTHVVQQTGQIQPYRKKGSFNFGKVDDPPKWVEQEFTSKTNQPWIKQINITFASVGKDADGNDTWNGTLEAMYFPNKVALPDFSLSISGGSVQVGKTDAGDFLVHRIEGISYNSGTYSDLTDGVGPGKRYTKNLGPANMHLAVFYNKGEAIHAGPLGSSSHGCVHVGASDMKQMRQINYHSLIGGTKVKVVYKKAP